VSFVLSLRECEGVIVIGGGTEANVVRPGPGECEGDCPEPGVDRTRGLGGGAARLDELESVVGISSYSWLGLRA
jgi:hypothetical protein